MAFFLRQSRHFPSIRIFGRPRPSKAKGQLQGSRSLAASDELLRRPVHLPRTNESTTPRPKLARRRATASRPLANWHPTFKRPPDRSTPTTPTAPVGSDAGSVQWPGAGWDHPRSGRADSMVGVPLTARGRPWSHAMEGCRRYRAKGGPSRAAPVTLDDDAVGGFLDLFLYYYYYYYYHYFLLGRVGSHPRSAGSLPRHFLSPSRTLRNLRLSRPSRSYSSRFPAEPG